MTNEDKQQSEELVPGKLEGILAPPPGISQKEWEERLGISDEGIMPLSTGDAESEIAQKVADALVAVALAGELQISETEEGIDKTGTFDPDEALEAASKPSTSESVLGESSDGKDSENSGTQKGRRGPRVFVWLLSIVLFVLVACYGVGVYWFNTHYAPNTVVGNTDISWMTHNQAAVHLQETAYSYVLLVKNNDFQTSISGTDIDFALDVEHVLASIEMRRNSWAWPAYMIQGVGDLQESFVTFDSRKFESLITTAVAEFNKTATYPKDAALAWDSASQKAVISSSSMGSALEVTVVLEEARQALLQMSNCALSQNALAMPAVLDDDAELNALVEKINASGYTFPHVVYQMDGIDVLTLDISVVALWLDFAEDGSASLNDNRLTAWCKEQAASLSTLHSQRTYQRADGKICTVSGGTYGSVLDKNTLAEAVRQACNDKAEGIVSLDHTGTIASWSGVGSADWGKRYIDVDITEQHVRFYDETGAMVWESDCVTGSPGRDTTVGVWTIFHMASPTVLIGADYRTPVDYWMKFTSYGIGLHDATWQSSFGGTRYKDGYGSHGCVNLPLEAAGSLYALVRVGDVVVVHM